jgi:outer membrane protein assembly factor BamB
MRRFFAALAVVVGITAVQGRAPELAWPQFRGPSGAGVLDAGKLPTSWNTTDNVKWSVEVKGRGWSSPVAWRNTVFVTSAISPGAFKAPSTGIFGNDYVAELMKQGLPEDEVNKRVIARDIELTSESGEIRYMVYAFDAASGKPKWEREAHKGAPFGGRHRKNTFASETPTTDGERLYVYFGNVGLFAYSMDGKPLWNTRFDPQPMYLDFGTAASPVVHDGKVFVVHDNEGQSFVAAVDARTGKHLWRMERDLKAPQGSGWSSPFIWAAESADEKTRAAESTEGAEPNRNHRTELIVIGRQHAIAYAPDSGKELWRLRGLTGQSTPTPVAGEGLLYLATGSQGESNRPIFAVRTGASGDISLAKGEESNTFVAWFHPRASAYTSSPLVYHGRIYIVNDNGIMTVLDSQTGKEIYKVRAGGSGNTFSASPWAADGKIYLLSEDGHTFVIEAGDKYVELAKNSVDEMSFASPALAPDTIFLRTQTKLYRIGR